MNAKRALCFVIAALACACAETPTWDTSVFPPQPTYSFSGAATPAAPLADADIAK